MGHIQDLKVDKNLWVLARLMDIRDWSAVGRSLGLPENTANNIEAQYQYEQYKFQDKSYKMLQEWRKVRPTECTLGNIIIALKDNDCNAVIQNITAKFGLAPGATIPQPGIQLPKPLSKISFKEGSLLVVGTKCKIYSGKFGDSEAAIKNIPRNQEDKVENELDILRQMDPHKNIIKYFGKEEDDTMCYVAFELCQGNLKDYIRSEEQLNGNKLLPIDLMHNIAQGLNYIHSRRIVHGDIKPENILISKPDQYFNIRPVISDFVNSQLDQINKSLASPMKNNSGFTAYEILEGKSWTKSADIFSLGCIYYYVASNGEQMFNSDKDVLKRPPKMDDLKKDEGELQNFILLMIKRDPKQRLSCEQILNSPLFFNPGQTLNFLVSVSNWIISDILDANLPTQLESNSHTVINDNWKEKLSPGFQELLDAELGLNYDFKSIKDLLRLIRNKSQHYDKVPVDLKTEFSSYPEGYCNYFTSRFPKLIWSVYEVFKDFEKPKENIVLQHHKDCECQYAPPSRRNLGEDATKVVGAHNDKIHHVSCSHNGKLFVTSSGNHQVKVWEWGSVKQVYSKNLDWPVLVSYFNANDELLLVCGDKEIQVLSIKDNLKMKCKVTCRSGPTYGDWYNDEIFLSGDKIQRDHMILWLNKVPPAQVNTADNIKRFQIYKTADAIHNSKIITTKTNAKLLISQFQTKLVINELANSYENELDRSGSNQEKDWDVPSHEIPFMGIIRDFKVSPDEEYIFVMIYKSEEDYMFQQLHLETYQLTPFKLNCPVAKESISGDYACSYFDINSYYVSSVNSTNDALVWDLEDGKCSKYSHDDKVTSVTFHPNEPHKLLTACFNGYIKVHVLNK